jgi:hypothetical protein
MYTHKHPGQTLCFLTVASSGARGLLRAPFLGALNIIPLSTLTPSTQHDPDAANAEWSYRANQSLIHFELVARARLVLHD